MEKIPDYNLFMMCERLQKNAMAPLPPGYSVRHCREEELEIWKALNAGSLQDLPFLTDYFERVYRGKGSLFFEKCLFVCDGQDRPVGTCFFVEGLRRNHHAPLAEGAAAAGGPWPGTRTAFSCAERGRAGGVSHLPAYASSLLESYSPVWGIWFPAAARSKGGRALQ